MTPDEFERRVQRIFRVLTAEGATVDWNEKVVDPADGETQRQIDVRIERDGLQTLVECRLRKRIQDVSWIEDVHAKRLGLGFDGAIAVSSSGFSKLAKAKANQFGVQVYDFTLVSDQEIATFGMSCAISVKFLKFKTLRIDLMVEDGSLLHGKQQNEIKLADGTPFNSLFAIDALKNDLVDKLWNRQNNWIKGQASLPIPGARIGDTPIKAARIVFEVKMINRPLNMTGSLLFGPPDSEIGARSAGIIEYGELSGELISDNSKGHWKIDLSKMPLNEDEVFATVMVDWGKATRLMGCEFIGLHSVANRLPNIELQILTSG